MAEYMLIYIERDPLTTFKKVQDTINLARDWFRINEKTWIVYTTSDTAKWNARLAPLAKPNGTFFVCRLDVTKRTGWMKKSFWDWLGKPR